MSRHSSTRADVTEPGPQPADLGVPSQPLTPSTHGLPSNTPHTHSQSSRGRGHSLTGAPCCRETEQPEVEGSGRGHLEEGLQPGSGPAGAPKNWEEASGPLSAPCLGAEQESGGTGWGAASGPLPVHAMRSLPSDPGVLLGSAGPAVGCAVFPEVGL